MGTASIPRCIEDLTPQWLTGALREGGVIRDATVTSRECAGIGAGAGFLGQLARLHLDYDRPEKGAPSTLIAKMPTLDPGGREICRIFQFYEREIRFYDDVAKGIDLRVPRCYYAAMNVAADDYLLLLEDLCDVRMGDEVAGCSAAEAELAIRSIAQLHAKWWQSPKLDALTWMPYIDAPVHQSAEPAYNQALDPFLQMFGDQLSPAMRNITENLRTHIIDLLHTLEPPPRTLVHGDYRLDNIFFGEGDASIAVIDWQISSRGRGIFDVAYFLSSCLDPEIRRAEEMRLLRLWHDTVTDGRAGYSLDDALTDYRRALLFCHNYTVIGVANLAAANERGLALFHAWLSRRSAAIEDLNAAELIPN